MASTSESKLSSCSSECSFKSCKRRCNSTMGFSKSSGCDSIFSVANSDSGLLVDKAAQLFDIRRGQAKPGRWWRLFQIGVGCIGDRVNRVGGCGQPDPARAAHVFLGAEANPFATAEGHHF